MAISAATAVSPTHTADSAAANAAALLAGDGDATQAGAFIDSLEAVLGVRGVAAGNTGSGDSDLQSALLTQGSLAKFKSKLKGDTADTDTIPASLLAALPASVQQQIAQQMAAPSGQQAASQQTPAQQDATQPTDARGTAQQTQPVTAAQTAQQQAAINALENTNAGIDMPALRAAMAKAGDRSGGVRTMPPPKGTVTTKTTANATVPAPTSDITKTASTTANASTDPADTANVSTPTVDTATGNTASDPSKTAGDKASQAKLVTALAKNAQSPVLKGNVADGSKVPNAKIGHHAHAEKQDGQTSADQVAQMATKIAATAGAATPDTAPTAAQAVAVAEVATKAAAATPTITKIEAAAMDNSVQTAIHASAPQAKTEAQALPIQFDAQQPTKTGDDKAGNQSDSNSKDQDASDGSRTANSNAQTSSAPPAQSPADAQQQQPIQPTPASTQTASANATTTADLAATINNTATTTQTPSPVVANLHVAPQAQQTVPTADQATFAALGVAIAAKSKDGQHQFDIKLDPVELGKVDVRISVDSSGQAQAHLSVQHQQTLELLQNDKATLARDLRDAGLNLANNGLNFSLKGEQQQSTPTFNARNRALSISAVQSTDSISSTSSTSIAPGDSRLDIRV